jgi:hypothetical protein
MTGSGAFIWIVAVWGVAIDAIDGILRPRSCSVQPSMVSDHPVSRITHITDVWPEYPRSSESHSREG